MAASADDYTNCGGVPPANMTSREGDGQSLSAITWFTYDDVDDAAFPFPEENLINLCPDCHPKPSSYPLESADLIYREGTAPESCAPCGRLRARARDLYEALALPLASHPALCERLLTCLKQQEFNREHLSARQAAVLEALGKTIQQHPCEEFYSLGSVTKDANQELVNAGESFHLNEKAAGSVLASLDLANRERTKAGYVLLLDEATRRYIHDCLVQQGSGYPWGNEGAACQLCPPLATGQPDSAGS